MNAPRANQSVRQASPAQTVAQAYLELLTARGVQYLFGNAGTDFAPLLDAFAWAQATAQCVLTPVTVPHEMVAASMAHGYYLATDRPQVVMTHVNVGTANALTGIINAASENVPIIFTAGRTPLTETGAPGSRGLSVHWAQESFDQAAMVREYVKWDYELRRADQLETVIDRALTIALTPPRGPVYLTLPREVLAEKLTTPFTYSSPSRQCVIPAAHPDPTCIAAAANLLAAAQAPLVITTSVGRTAAAVDALLDLAQYAALPVVMSNSRYMNFPTAHPLHLGFDPQPFFAKNPALYAHGADVILVVDSDVPWIPARGSPSDSAHVIQLAHDPSYARYPIRGFPCDVPLAGEPAASLRLLRAALQDRLDPHLIEGRATRLQSLHDVQRQHWHSILAGAATTNQISMEYATHCIDAIKDDDTIVINEYNMVSELMRFSRPGTQFEQCAAAGLGWALGAAMGLKLGAPDRTVITIVGDGSYMLGNPTPAHFVSTAHPLPTLTVIFNNQSWHAVRQANLAMYKNGWCQKTGYFPFTDLTPSPQFELIAQACGAYGKAVTDPQSLPAELQLALNVVRHEKRPAVLNVYCTRNA